MAELEVTIEGDEGAVTAKMMLDTANRVLRLLRSVERDITKKPPKVQWRLDLFTARHRGVARFSHPIAWLKPGNKEMELVAVRVTATVMKIMRDVKDGTGEPPSLKQLADGGR